MSQNTHCLGSVVPLAMLFSGNLGLFGSFFNCSVIDFAVWLVWRHGGGRKGASRRLEEPRLVSTTISEPIPKKRCTERCNCAFVSFVHPEYHIGFQSTK